MAFCLEKIAIGSYLSMAAHPDGSNRAFFSNQMGKVWLVNIPAQGSEGELELDESNPFVDLTDQVYFDNSKFRMMGMAFHLDFANLIVIRLSGQDAQEDAHVTQMSIVIH